VTRNVVSSDLLLCDIGSLALILCHGVRDLKKQHYKSHASDPMSRSKRSEETTFLQISDSVT
jgi:hypothetical protein